MRGFQLTVIWYKATVLHVNINLFWFLLLCHGPICCFHFWFPFHALHRHLVSVYIIDQETHCICNNSHSTFPFHLSWMFNRCRRDPTRKQIPCLRWNGCVVLACIDWRWFKLLILHTRSLRLTTYDILWNQSKIPWHWLYAVGMETTCLYNVYIYIYIYRALVWP